MARTPCCEKIGLKKGPWSKEEDQILINYINRYGHANWRTLPKNAGLLRCGKSCRLRWMNYLRPDIKRGHFSDEEDAAIVRLHQTLGNRWSAFAARLPGRTDNEIKNIWRTRLKKRAHDFGPTDVSGNLEILENFPFDHAMQNDPTHFQAHSSSMMTTASDVSASSTNTRAVAFNNIFNEVSTELDALFENDFSVYKNDVLTEISQSRKAIETSEWSAGCDDDEFGIQFNFAPFNPMENEVSGVSSDIQFWQDLLTSADELSKFQN